MDSRPNIIDIFKHTGRNNCGRCGHPTCMAFAALVARGVADPSACPDLTPALVASLTAPRNQAPLPYSDQLSLVDELRQKVRGLNLAALAPRLGGEFDRGRLVLRCLGRIFELDPDGGLHSESHVNLWVHGAVLQYVAVGEGLDPTGHWIAIDDMTDGQAWAPFFVHRCHFPLIQAADRVPDLFLDVLGLFGKKIPFDSAENAFLLHPLPKAPFLFLFSAREGRFETQLTILFDECIDRNLKTQGVYLLGAGIADMIVKIMARHGE